MRTTADVVIIGGGIVGVAVAFYLAQQKYGRIVLVEKEKLLGSGATSKAAGGIRAQFSTRVNIEMSMLAEKIFANFEEETGAKALFDRVGYMFLLQRDTDIQQFKEAYQLQQSLGLKVELLAPEEISRVAPHVRIDDIKMATYCSNDGLGDPHEFLTGYEQADRRLGVNFELDTEVTDIAVSGGKIIAVETGNGNISTPLVINCAGPQARLIGAMVDAELPVDPIRRQIVTTGELDFVKPYFPMVVDVESGLYCHKESKGMLLGWADGSVEPSFDTSIDPDYTDAILEKALHRIPQLEEAEIANQWAGLYETTPDHHAIIGYEPVVSGMFHVTGFSGHGFMQAPAAGLVTAQILTGLKPSLDISKLAPDRFVTGTVVNETNVI